MTRLMKQSVLKFPAMVGGERTIQAPMCVPVDEVVEIQLSRNALVVHLINGKSLSVVATGIRVETEECSSPRY